MQKKFNQVPRLLVILILGLTITVLGFVAYVSSVTKAQAQTTYSQVGFGLYKSPYSPAVAGDKIGAVPLKIKAKCLALQGCNDDRDCDIEGCIAGNPDEEAVFQGSCVNKKCQCDYDAIIESKPCPTHLPRCYATADINGREHTACAQCNGPSDCESKDSICKDDNTLVNYEPTCDQHQCAFREIIIPCPDGCAIVDGEAKCVGCLKDSQCPAKKDTCKNAYIKTSWQGACINNTCDYVESGKVDCQKYKPHPLFCYQKPNNDFATCESCFTDEQCGETRPPKCNRDRKSYNTTAWQCKNYSCGGLQTKKMCTGSTPYCQNGGCIQCQYYTDCAASIPKTKCKDAKTIESYVLRNAKCKFNKCEFTATTKACPSSTPYCKDDNGKVSCVQCLSESQCTHLNTPLTYGCTGNTLFKYWATCSANKCNAKGKKWGEVDCSQYKYSNSSTLNLSCLASKGKCGCTTNSQCAKLPDKLSACIPNLYYKTNPTQYMQYNKVCDSNNDCGYKTSTETCQNNTICFDTKTGSKCIACQTNTDCAYMGKDPKYQTKCADKDITTFYFTCKMNNQDPTTSECVAHEETNVCLNGCYQDEQGNNVCKDCKSDSECTKPPVPAVACAKDKKSGYYYDSQGYCRSNTRLCDYGKASVTCVDIPVVTKCKNAQTLITSGPITSCLVQGSKVICNPQIREKKCYGSCKQYGKHAFCSLW